MNESSIALSRLYYDEDCWEIEIRASNGRFTAATFDPIYTQPEELARFAEQLVAFPKTIKDEARFEQGDPASESAHILVRAFLFDGSGHSAIEFAARDHPNARFASSSRFYLFAEAAAINRFGQRILTWLHNPHEPLHWIAQGE